MIKKEDYYSLTEDLALGEQIHINHVGCSAGIDIKERLYLKKVPGAILAYCHHCSQHGVTFTKDSESIALKRWLQDKPTGDVIDITCKNIERANTVYDIISVYLQNWLRERGIIYIDTTFIGSTLYDDLIMEIYDPYGNHRGQQIRFVEPKGARFSTTYFTENIMPGDAAWFNKSINHTLFITEDYLSAYRIFKDTPYNAVALLKTTMSKATENEIRHYGTNVVVWLDPDEAGIAGARKIAKRLDFILSTKVRNYTSAGTQEPKWLVKSDLDAHCYSMGGNLDA